MKNIISILVIILLLSCTAKKTTTRSLIDEKVTQRNEITDLKKNQTEVNKTVVDQSNSDLETTTETTTYDTDKPVNKDTGKPPIKSETKTTTTKSKKNDVKTDIAISEKDESSHKDQSKLHGQAKEETKVVEKSKPIDGINFFYTLAILVIAVLGFLVYRYFARVKTFLGWFN